MAKYLATCIQDNYPYHVDRLDSNDSLYAQDEEFIKEVETYFDIIFQESLDMFKKFQHDFVSFFYDLFEKERKKFIHSFFIIITDLFASSSPFLLAIPMIIMIFHFINHTRYDGTDKVCKKSVGFQ